MANRPSRLVVPVFRASADGRYWGPYPNGDAPIPGILAGGAAAAIAAAGILSTGIQLGGAATVAEAVSASLTAGAALSWQLPAGHYTPSVAVPVIVSPRPDSETNSWERHRLCPAGIPWRYAVAMDYGAWPFHYAITAGPSGLTIGSDLGTPNYGIATWSNPVAGTYTVTIQITTQDYGRLSGSQDPTGQYSVSFTLEVAPTTDPRFVALDATNGVDTNTGSLAAPWKTLTAFNAASTNNKQLFFRAGTYNLNVLSSVLDLTSKAKVWVGYPGESATINYGGTWSGTNCYTYFNGGTVGGCSASGLTFFGSPSNWAGGGNDLYHINHWGDRGVYYENVFDSLNGLGKTPTNFSNWCAIAMFANASMHDYVVSKNNTIQNFQQLYSGGAHIWYSNRYWVIEGNTIQGFKSPTNVQQGFISKGHSSRGTMRANTAWVQGGSFTSPTLYNGIGGISTGCYYQPQGNDGNQGDDPNYNETCWNMGFNPPAGNNGVTPGASIYGSASYKSWTGWIHRNTFVGPNYMAAGSGFPSTLLFQNNVALTEHGIQNDADHYSGFTGPLTVNASGNVVDSYTNRNSIVDGTTGFLLGAYASAHSITIGTVGHQVQ